MENCGMGSSLPKPMKLIISALICGATPSAWADYTLNMTKGVSEVSASVQQLHMTILWVCVAIGVVVYSLMIYAIIRHRKSRGAVPATFHESTTVELIWTIIPFIILIGMAIPATKTLIILEDTSNSDVTIKVTGYRWYWHYDYLDEDINFFSYLTTPENELMNIQPKNENYLLEVDNPIVVPVGKKIRFLITAKDVLHSWWVPALGFKKDAIPGFINESWTKIDIDKPGIYRGQCAELCGAKHGYMPIVLEAKSQEDYDIWIKEQQDKQNAAQADEGKEWTFDELMARGEKDYNTVCAMCHQTHGKGMPPTFPSLVGSDMVVNKERVVDHIKNVLYGKGAMPAWGEQKSDLEIAAIITYERNAWGNKTGDIVQPKDIKAQREQN
jgi:cytochrome c oxidase subunit 2